MYPIELDMKLARQINIVSFSFAISLLLNCATDTQSADGRIGYFAANPSTKLPFRDTNLPIRDRVADLISRMTLEEKTSQMVMESAPIPRLGIPAYHWWNECIHGVARAGRATQFPQSIALASTWNPGLLSRVASAIGDELRAKHPHDGDSPQYQGLTCWSPTVNMARDPRWGRTEETYGEDPYLVAQLGIAAVQGFQGDRMFRDKKHVVATLKHFAAHGQPESGTNCAPANMI